MVWSHLELFSKFLRLKSSGIHVSRISLNISLRWFSNRFMLATGICNVDHQKSAWFESDRLLLDTNHHLRCDGNNYFRQKYCWTMSVNKLNHFECVKWLYFIKLHGAKNTHSWRNNRTSWIFGKFLVNNFNLVVFLFVFLPEEPEQTKPILDHDHDYIFISSQNKSVKNGSRGCRKTSTMNPNHNLLHIMC